VWGQFRRNLFGSHCKHADPHPYLPTKAGRSQSGDISPERDATWVVTIKAACLLAGRWCIHDDGSKQHGLKQLLSLASPQMSSCALNADLSDAAAKCCTGVLHGVEWLNCYQYHSCLRMYLLGWKPKLIRTDALAVKTAFPQPMLIANAGPRTTALLKARAGRGTNAPTPQAPVRSQ
jgi:hypothetical protein